MFKGVQEGVKCSFSLAQCDTAVYGSWHLKGFEEPGCAEVVTVRARFRPSSFDTRMSLDQPSPDPGGIRRAGPCPHAMDGVWMA